MDDHERITCGSPTKKLLSRIPKSKMVEHFSTNRSPVSNTIRRYSCQDNTLLSDIYKLLIISLYFYYAYLYIYILIFNNTCRANIFFDTHPHTRTHPQKKNLGMRSVFELFLAVWVEMRHFVYLTFSFL